MGNGICGNQTCWQLSGMAVGGLWVGSCSIVAIRPSHPTPKSLEPVFPVSLHPSFSSVFRVLYESLAGRGRGGDISLLHPPFPPLSPVLQPCCSWFCSHLVLLFSCLISSLCCCG